MIKILLSTAFLVSLGGTAFTQRTLDMKCFKIDPHGRKQYSFQIYHYEGNKGHATLVGGGYFEKRYPLIHQSESGIKNDLVINDFYRADRGHIIVKYSKKERAQSPKSFPALELLKKENTSFEWTVLCEEG